jgi:hypothetical protein
MSAARRKDSKEVKLLSPKTPDIRYLGNEPVWDKQPEAAVRAGEVARAMNWYNYYYDKKDARGFLMDWLRRADRDSDAELFKSVPDAAIKTTAGWFARMNTVGLVLSEHEEAYLLNFFKNNLAAVKDTKKVTEEAPANKPNIQDRMREKAMAVGGELEGRLDDFVRAGARAVDEFKPMDVLRASNPAPQMVGEIASLWTTRIAEFEQVIEGRDAQLVEGYSNFTKVQMKNMIKAAQSVIDACGSYVQIKKVERKPRKKKAVSPEKLARRFKYLREDTELKLKGLDATSLVNANEAWLYNVKKRKLIHVVADAHAGTFTIKGNTLIGISPADTVQKTLRKPAEQIKALMSAGKPAARKVFKDIRSTEVKWNGRGNNDTIILRSW